MGKNIFPCRFLFVFNMINLKKKKTSYNNNNPVLYLLYVSMKNFEVGKRVSED